MGIDAIRPVRLFLEVDNLCKKIDEGSKVERKCGKLAKTSRYSFLLDFTDRRVYSDSVS
jgi:hypothetical protein